MRTKLGARVCERLEYDAQVKPPSMKNPLSKSIRFHPSATLKLLEDTQREHQRSLQTKGLLGFTFKECSLIAEN